MSYADIFSQFEALTIMVVGDVMIDSYWWADVRRISPEAPVPVCEVKEKVSLILTAFTLWNVNSFRSKAELSILGSSS